MISIRKKTFDLHGLYKNIWMLQGLNSLRGNMSQCLAMCELSSDVVFYILGFWRFQLYYINMYTAQRQTSLTVITFYYLCM